MKKITFFLMLAMTSIANANANNPCLTINQSAHCLNIDAVATLLLTATGFPGAVTYGWQFETPNGWKDTTGTGSTFTVTQVTGAYQCYRGWAKTQNGPKYYSDVVCVNAVCCIVPIKLTEFTAQKQGSIIELHWKTETEGNVTAFQIERSVDGVTFTTVLAVPAQRENGATRYHVVDNVASLRDQYVFYRINMVDAVGAAMYSNVVQVMLNNIDPDILIVPNPVYNRFEIKGIKDAAVLKIFAMNGSLVKTFYPIGTMPLDVSTLPNGTYNCVVVDYKTQVVVARPRFVKMK